MALTIRERIAVALKTALSGLVGVTIQRAPVTDFDETELPALGLFMGDEQTEPGPTTDVSINQMDVLIAGHAKGMTGEAAETAAHDLYGRALAAAVADYTLGGLLVDLRKTGLIMTFNTGVDGEAPLAGFELSLTAEYWTAAADATALAP